MIIGNTRKHSDVIRVNQVITSKNAQDFFVNFKFIYDLWVRKFNFLPEYYSEWTREWLLNLKKWFDQILDFYKDWNWFELVNLENYSDISFFNLWLVIDTDGTIYGTNLILSSRFEKYKKELKIGDIFTGMTTNLRDREISENYTNRIWSMVEKEYSKSVLRSVKYVDLLLNIFCNEIGKLNNQ
jgi:predicted acetyltransferase